MSQTDRKYDGPPVSEQRRVPVVTLPSDFHVNLPSPRKEIHPANIHIFHGKWTRQWDALSFSPFIYHSMRLWHREFAAEHVIKRMKGILLRDERMPGVVWVEDQATKCQITPEFSNMWCLLNWLEYKGLEKGWLKVRTSTIKDWRTSEERFHVSLERV